MKYYKRGFLDETEGLEAFEAHVDDYGHCDGMVWAAFTVTDCDGKVTLSFNAGTDVQCIEALAKLGRLIEELESFKVALTEGKSRMCVDEEK